MHGCVQAQKRKAMSLDHFAEKEGGWNDHTNEYLDRTNKQQRRDNA
jgi:hypothetical protein